MGVNLLIKKRYWTWWNELNAVVCNYENEEVMIGYKHLTYKMKASDINHVNVDKKSQHTPSSENFETDRAVYKKPRQTDFHYVC
jgi:hypothetical protein